MHFIMKINNDVVCIPRFMRNFFKLVFFVFFKNPDFMELGMQKPNKNPSLSVTVTTYSLYFKIDDSTLYKVSTKLDHLFWNGGST